MPTAEVSIANESQRARTPMEPEAPVTRNEGMLKDTLIDRMRRDSVVCEVIIGKSYEWYI